MNRRKMLATLMSLPAATVITRTEIRTHDLLVFSSPHPISMEQAERIKQFAEEYFKELNVRAIVLGDGLTLSIVREGAEVQ